MKGAVTLRGESVAPSRFTLFRKHYLAIAFVVPIGCCCVPATRGAIGWPHPARFCAGNPVGGDRFRAILTGNHALIISDLTRKLTIGSTTLH